MTKHTLREYQKAGVKFLTTRPASLLGDHQGLGKTPQTIVACKESNDHRVLIFCPNAMVGVWLEEIAEWDAGAKAFALQGGTVAKKKTLLAEYQSDNPERRYFVTNWETLAVKKPLPFANLRWSTVIADEAHAIKNRKAKRTKALKQVTNVGSKRVRKIALTGTPFDKYPDEMWSILNWLDKSRWSSYWRFREQYLETQMRPWGEEIVGLKFGGTQLRRDLRPWVLRRTKNEVMKELPEKQWQYFWTDISQLQYDLYEQLTEDFYLEYGEDEEEIILDASTILSRYTRFQQLVISPAVLDPGLPDDSPRLDAIVEYIAFLNEPVIVVGSYVEAVRLLKKRFAKHKQLKNVPVWTYMGETSNADREKARKEFQSIPTGESGILIGTIPTMHLGLTLTRASHMVFVDRSWQRMVNEQMEDRIHRFGQKNAANYAIFGIPETVDENKLKAISDKDDNFTRVFPSAIIGKPTKPGKLRVSKGS